MTSFLDDEYNVAFERKLHVLDSFEALLSEFQMARTAFSVVASGQRKILQYAIDQGNVFSEYTLCIVKANGDVHLEYVDSCLLAVNAKKRALSPQPFLGWLATSAARDGNVTLLRSLHSMGTVLNPSLYIDAMCSVECLQYLLASKVSGPSTADYGPRRTR